MYFNFAKLFAKLKMAKADGSYLKELAKIEGQHLIILDDFGLHPMDNQSRLTFLEIIEYLHGKGSVIITSQLPVSGWYDIIGEKNTKTNFENRIINLK